MSTRQVHVIDILSRYAAGYFPLYDLEGNFYWERLPVRALIGVNEQTLRRAKRLAARGRGRFEIRYNTAVEEVIRQLQREEIKENSWVKQEVVRIYAELHGANLLRTVEAWDRQGNLAGALLGIDLPGTFIAETMFGTAAEASKVCLCRLVEDCMNGTGCVNAGKEMIDVQTPHDLSVWGVAEDEDGREQGALRITAHPCVRLGEIYLPISAYMGAFAGAWKRAFAGGMKEWLAAARDGGE